MSGEHKGRRMLPRMVPNDQYWGAVIHPDVSRQTPFRRQVMDTRRTQKELAEIATATAADVGYEAIRWWIDAENPSRLRVQARPLFGSSSVSIILLAHLPEAAAGESDRACP